MKDELSEQQTLKLRVLTAKVGMTQHVGRLWLTPPLQRKGNDMEALLVVLLVGAALIAGGIYLLTAFASLTIHIVGIVLLVLAGLWLWNRLIVGRRGARGPLV